MDALAILKETYDRRISAIEGVLITQNTQLRNDREILAKELERCVSALRASVRAKNVPIAQKTSAASESSEPTLADVILPAHCSCGQLIEHTAELEAHVERGCWRKA
jgi:hypothetical protein